MSNATFDGARTSRLSFVLVPLMLWIWLCRDWPARLGFYSDDWLVLLHPFVGTARAFRDIANLVTSRPVSIPYIWLAQVIVDWSPIRSQVLNAAMLLLSAASVGVLAAALVSASCLRQGALAAASAAAASFVLFPSTVGTFAWGVGVTTVVPTLPLFCLAMCLLLNCEGRPWRLGLGLLLSMLSHLAYEAFYFQEIFLILIAVALRNGTVKDIPWRVVIGAVVVNVGCVAFNRLTSSGVHKAFSWDFLRLFDAGYSHLLAILGHAIREHKFLVGLSVVGATLSGSVCLTDIIGPARARIALLAMIGAIVASGFLYAFAGYTLHAEGPMARVFIVIATFYSLAAGVLAAAAWCTSRKRRMLAAIFCLCAVAGLVALGSTARHRVGEWADTWTYESARLSRLPTAITSGDAAPGNYQRIYFAVDDGPSLVIDPASASWEIAGAVAWSSYKVTNSRLRAAELWKDTNTSPRWLATAPGWFNRWDGKNFEQGFCSNRLTIYSSPGSELWLWKTSISELRKAEAPWEYGCS